MFITQRIKPFDIKISVVEVTGFRPSLTAFSTYLQDFLSVFLAFLFRYFKHFQMNNIRDELQTNDNSIQSKQSCQICMYCTKEQLQFLVC